ncbi:hypothetical protein C3941_09425 [Kaistia algarum]|nr:hypothetical protein C3941_09425 [Kaistia algarum]
MTLAARIAASRLAPLPTAIATTLRPLFLGVQVKTHPGRIDVADVLAGDVFLPPMIAISVVAADPSVEIAGDCSVLAECCAYVVSEDMAIGNRSTGRDQVALAMCQGVADVLTDFDAPRWGLASITSPAEIRIRPLFTQLSFEKGIAFYATTWRQRLFELGSPMPLPMATERLYTIEDAAEVTLWPTEGVDDGDDGEDGP